MTDKRPRKWADEIAQLPPNERLAAIEKAPPEYHELIKTYLMQRFMQKQHRKQSA